jgi:UDP:flavonoid glycosyltransferase YjiC (YdhE family)
VRILFSFTGGSGHFLPTTPFARALARRGHDVLYTCQEAMADLVVADGWRVVPSGGATLLAPGQRRPLVAVDRLSEERAVRESFAGKLARERVPRLSEIMTQWRPDLVVRDEMDFAAAIAAELLEVAHASVAVIAAGGFTRPDVVREPLAALRSDVGLDPSDTMPMLHRYLSLVPVPPSYRDPRDPLPPTAHPVRPAVLEAGRIEQRPLRGPGTEHRPSVYFTLGTVFPQESGDLFKRVLAGLTALPVEVTVTSGNEIAAGELGDQPASVRIEPFLPLGEVLARSDVVVSHGGSGTVISSLAFGIPQVLLPMGADQPNNADRCDELGVAVILDALTSTPGEIAQATATVLREPAYRTNAERLRAEAASLPDARHAASLLEQLASTRTPIPDH